jgi:hypothetical protein
MERSEWKAYLRWLEQASARELRRRQQALVRLLARLRDPQVRGDARRMLRDLEQEIRARLEVSRVPARQRRE